MLAGHLDVPGYRPLIPGGGSQGSLLRQAPGAYRAHQPKTQRCVQKKIQEFFRGKCLSEFSKMLSLK